MANYSMYERVIPSFFEKWWWKYGIPNPFWIVYRQLIHEIIIQYRLEPIPAEHLVQGLEVPIEGSSVSEKQLRIKPGSFCGGLRTPHLHYAGELFELNQEQWADFSNKIVNNFRMKLDAAQAVTVESMLELSDAIDSLPISGTPPKRVAKAFQIFGRVIDTKTKKGLGGLRVEAWDKDLICHDLVGSAVTDSQGGFYFGFDESYFRELFLDRQPDLFFKVFQGNKMIKSTEDSVLWNVAAGETPIVIEVA